MHDPAAEALRWWSQAEDDRAFVTDMARAGRYFDKACFMAQQATEKAVKACLYGLGQREVLGHAILEFVRQLSRHDPAFSGVDAPAARLDRHYIPTRYPNGLPGGAPFASYSAEDLALARRDMDAVFAVAGDLLRARGILTSP